MTRNRSILGFLALGAIFLFTVAADAPKQQPADWAMNATIIEACSCPMFCQCYFNTEPAVHAGNEGIHKGHEQGHYCRFNNAFRINKGNYGATKLDGAKFFVSGDLGSDFSKLQTEWAVLTFDPSVTKEQRDGIAAILGRLYPVQWKSFTIANDAKVDWSYTKDEAHATLDGGKAAEVSLKRFQGHTNDPVVIKNLKYFGEESNTGFLMMPNTVEAYHLGDKAFEFHGTNGFMITINISSKTKATKAMM